MGAGKVQVEGGGIGERLVPSRVGRCRLNEQTRFTSGFRRSQRDRRASSCF